MIYIYILQLQDHMIMSSWFLNSYHIAYVLPFSFSPLLREGQFRPFLSLSLSLSLSHAVSPFLPLFPSFFSFSLYFLFLSLRHSLYITFSFSLSHMITIPLPFPSLLPPLSRFTTPNHIQIDQLDLATVQEAITSQLGPDAIEVTAARM